MGNFVGRVFILFVGSFMAVVGYMLTWTTYGSWLQGDRRGWVMDVKIHEGDRRLERVNRRQMCESEFRLNEQQRELVGKAILTEAKKIGQRIYGLAVCCNHVHVAADDVIMVTGRVVSNYKNSAIKELRKIGVEGKVWTQGFNKRFCNNEIEILKKVEYVCGHANIDAYVRRFC